MKAKLRVLLVIQPCWYGTGRHVIDLARGLVKLGHVVHLIYSSNHTDATFDQGLKELRDLNVKMTSLPMGREIQARDLSNLITIRRYLKREGPFDIIHSHALKACALAHFSGVGYSKVHINTTHAIGTTNTELGPAKKWTYGKIEKFLGWLSHGVIAVSKEEYLHILETGVPDRKLFLVPNGIDLSSRTPAISRREIGLEESDVCIGFVGRFSAQKAPEILLRAFASLISRFPNARLAMVGGGYLEPILRSEAKGFGIEERVLWLGKMNGSTIMPAFDIFALPSNYEGHPYVLLEAMAAGLPIVVTKVGGVEATIMDGVNGHIVPPGCSELFAEALVPLLESKDLRNRMGEASREHCKNFSLEKMVNETVTVYETFLNRN